MAFANKLITEISKFFAKNCARTFRFQSMFQKNRLPSRNLRLQHHCQVRKLQLSFVCHRLHLYIPTSLIHLHGHAVPVSRENRTTFTKGAPSHIGACNTVQLVISFLEFILRTLGVKEWFLGNILRYNREFYQTTKLDNIKILNCGANKQNDRRNRR